MFIIFMVLMMQTAIMACDTSFSLGRTSHCSNMPLRITDACVTNGIGPELKNAITQHLLHADFDEASRKVVTILCWYSLFTDDKQRLQTMINDLETDYKKKLKENNQDAYNALRRIRLLQFLLFEVKKPMNKIETHTAIIEQITLLKDICRPNTNKRISLPQEASQGTLKTLLIASETDTLSTTELTKQINNMLPYWKAQTHTKKITNACGDCGMMIASISLTAALITAYTLYRLYYSKETKKEDYNSEEITNT